MRIGLGADAESAVVDAVAGALAADGHEVVRVAPGARWAEVGDAVGRAVAAGDVDRGVVCCWTGTGVSMAANKVDGVRAALCVDAETAAGARRWNDANVLALSLRLTTEAVAREIVSAFLAAEPDGSEDEQIDRLR
jgi:ribose 5-phosphate isomerase B